MIEQFIKKFETDFSGLGDKQPAPLTTVVSEKLVLAIIGALTMRAPLA